MAPKRAKPKQFLPAADVPATAALTLASTSTSPFLSSEVGPQVSGALQQWTEGGQATLRQLITSQIDQVVSTSSTLAAVPLSHTLIELFSSSSLEVSTIVDFLTTVIGGLDEERVATFGEILVDVVEVMEEEKEDSAEDQKNGEGDAKMEEQAVRHGLPVIKLLLESQKLPSHIPNLLLNPNRLVELNLHPYPRNPPALQHALVKRNTALFFKQRKFNLLRECSEGFSGLIVLLTGPDALPHSSTSAEESDTARKDRAKRVWSKIMGLIGYFNLSPPRVLDIILEISSCHVAVHWRFFLDLLRCSPWGVAAIEVEGKGKGKAVDSTWADQDVQGIAEALSQPGDRVLGQVLGFKFSFYQKPEGGDTPIGLTYMTALLIKHGFVSLADLLPFLSPDDAEMVNIKKKWSSSVSSRSGPSNALSNSVLLDDEPPASTDSKDAETSGPPPKPPPEQRLQLLQALLAIGDLPSSLFFLAKFPWVAQSHTAIADLILRILSDAVDGLYRSYAGLKTDTADDEYEFGAIAPTVESVTKEVVPTLYAPPPIETTHKLFEFFYPAWRDESEVWTDIDEIHTKGLRWLSLIRGLGGRNAAVMVKLCRIGSTYFTTLRKEKEATLGVSHTKSKEQAIQVEPTVDEMKPWLDLIRTSLLPSLSSSSATAAFDVELWSLLKFFPYTVRYSLYGEWRDSTCSFKGRNPCLVAAHSAAECTKEVQKALRRVTSSSTSGSATAATQAERYSARYLAKLSHGNPLFLWTTAVTQVKAYPNIGQAIVDAGRYMTQLSFDVATFVMLDTLSDDRAMRLNETGTGVALWLERLSKFVGDFNRRYANMDLDPVLQYIMNRLMRGHSGDLIILEKLMSTMSGLEPVPNDGVSETQLRAYAGGREIIREAFQTTRISIAPPPEPGSTDKPKEAPVDKIKNIKKSLPRFVNTLRDTKLALPIWIALAQTRQGVVDKLANTPIKAMNLVQDSCHTAFVQFGDFLVEQLSSEEHMSLTPDLIELVNDFGLEYGMAFQILRPRLNSELEKMKSEEKAAVQKRLLAEKKAMSERTNSPSTGAEGTPLPVPAAAQAEGDDVVMEEVKEEQVNGNGEAEKPNESITIPGSKAVGGKAKLWWPAALTSTMQQARKLLPRDANEVLSAPFFVIFWHLTMSDIAFSAESYDDAIKAINRNISVVSGWRINPKDKPALTEQQAELSRLKARVSVLSKEKEVQGALVNGPNRRRLRLESAKWFGKSIVEKTLQRPLAFQLHQYCFYPRAILTPCDAVFVAKFIRTAHDLGTVGFSTLFAYNNFFNDNLAACIFSCTDSEARNLGRCLAAILTDLDAWHQDEQKYRKEALGLSTGDEAETPLPGMLFRPKAGDDMRPMSWQEFRNFYAKCHNVLSRALVSCWSDAEFMHNKNAIIVALQVIKFFPVMETNGKAIETAVKKLQAGENGEITNDLKMMCLSFLTGLKKRQEARPYVSPAVFHGAGARSVPAKSVPTGPKVADSPAVDGGATPQASAANGSSTPAAASGVSATPDPKALRQKLEEGRGRTASNNTGATVKDEAKGTSQSSKAETPPISRPVSPSRSAATTPPAGPRVTRSSAAPSGPGGTARSQASAQNDSKTGVPTGPANGRGAQDRQPSSASMGPPAELSIDEARAAARARKFGTINRPTPPPPSLPSAPAAAATSADAGRANTPTSSSRRTSPAARTHRSGSVESRASERSRRDRRDRDDRDHGRERERDRGRDRPKDDKSTDDRAGRQSRDVSEKRSTAADEEKERKRQEELLQARHDRLASTVSDDKRETRRSSRDAGSGHRNKDSERDRDDRRSKDKDKERGSSHRGADDSGHKRKRDDEPRRIDAPGEGRRDDRRERDRDRDRDRERRHERPDDRRDRGDRHRDERDRERDRDGDRRTRRDRDPVPASRGEHRPHSPGGSHRHGGARDSAPPSAAPSNGDRTPKRDAPRELLPPRPAAESDRIVEPPRSSQPPAAAAASRVAHGLPPRPSAGAAPSNNSAPAPGRQSAPSGNNNSSSLASRMGPPLPALASGSGSAPTASSNPRASPQRSDATEQATRDDAESKGGVEPRKRTLEEVGSTSREESPGLSKRVKIDRDRARGRREPGGGSGGGGGGGVGGAGRMFSAAMGEARDK
ncbi:hypothetical protein CI109_100563 [Kwoniella shandongensis]|uniref:THO complex subunit 2 n=1 Tax=Kwoniella shandongensis TaxID=1734106 RepID=A0A5M6BZE3_9TREE|nr:uncharacterized protein CI109_003516 [Kwoniella shandongensis]KAA5528227.1 hypothetical protein CI109_003516 [Kwoniella shandongensis]